MAGTLASQREIRTEDEFALESTRLKAAVAALVLFLIAAIYRVPPEGAASLRSSRAESPRLSRGASRALAGAHDLAGLPAGALMVLPGELLLPQNRAAGMGIFFTWYYAGLAVLTPIGGILRDASGVAGAALILLVDWSLRHRAFCSYFGYRNADPAQRKAVGASYR